MSKRRGRLLPLPPLAAERRLQPHNLRLTRFNLRPARCNLQLTTCNLRLEIRRVGLRRLQAEAQQSNLRCTSCLRFLRRLRLLG